MVLQTFAIYELLMTVPAKCLTFETTFGRLSSSNGVPHLAVYLAFWWRYRLKPLLSRPLLKDCPCAMELHNLVFVIVWCPYRLKRLLSRPLLKGAPFSDGVPHLAISNFLMMLVANTLTFEVTFERLSLSYVAPNLCNLCIVDDSAG